MMIVPCPWCGPRNASDLRYVGEARRRPEPATTTPEEWRAYLYLHANPAGPTTETWYCRGCRRYFVAERDTITNTFTSSRPPGRQPSGEES